MTVNQYLFWAPLEFTQKQTSPSRAWNRWLPKTEETFSTLVFRTCSSGLVRLAWYWFSSPTALLVSEIKEMTSVSISVQLLLILMPFLHYLHLLSDSLKTFLDACLILKRLCTVLDAWNLTYLPIITRTPRRGVQPDVQLNQGCLTTVFQQADKKKWKISLV